MTETGDHKDSKMIRQLLSESICVSGQNIKDMIKHNSNKWGLPKLIKMESDFFTARKMEKSLNNYIVSTNPLYDVTQQTFGPLDY